MAVRFLVGRAGVGKTAACLRAAVAGLDENPFVLRRLLLVPEQASLQMEQALVGLCPRGAYSAVCVLSFSTLSALMLEHTGLASKVLSAAARRMALRHLCMNDEALRRAFGSAAESSGFVRELDTLVTRLLQSGLPPEGVGTLCGDLAGASADQLSTIGGLYARYLAWLGTERIDPAARLAAMRDQVARLPWITHADVWVDGFAGFSGLEMGALAELAAHARSVTITLLLDPRSPSFRNEAIPLAADELFAETLRTYHRLRRTFSQRGVLMEEPSVFAAERPPRFETAPALVALEARWCARQSVDASPAPADDSLRLIEAPTVRAEVAAAARHIRTRMAAGAGKLGFRDFAVIARNLDQWVDAVRSVFSEYQIPHFIDQRRPLAAHPLARALRFAFEAALSDYATVPMVELLRTEMTPLSRVHAELLETIIATHTARGRSCWCRPEPWLFVDDARRGPPQDRYQPAANTTEADLHAGRFALFHAIDVLNAPHVNGQRLTGTAWAKRVFDCLNGLGTPGRLAAWIQAEEQAGEFEAAETHRAAWKSVCEILEDLHTVLGDVPLSLVEAAELVNEALSSRTLAMAPPALDQVLVSSIERSRHPEISDAWLLGWTDGVFPQPPPEGGILRAEARLALASVDVDVEPDAMQALRAERLLAYIAMTRSSQRVTVSWSQTSADGEQSVRSRFVNEISSYFPALLAERVELDEIVSITDAARVILKPAPQESATARGPALRSALQKHPQFGPAIQPLLRGLSFQFQPEPVGNFRRRPEWPADIVWWPSPSEVEAYIQCPYQHFLKYGLRLNPELGRPQPVDWDLGSEAHEVLARVTMQAIQAGTLWSAQDWQAALEAAIEERASTTAPDLVQRQPRLAYLRRALGVILRERVTAIAGTLARGVLRPRVAEWELNEERPTRLVSVSQGQHVALKGKLDRVDMTVGRGKPLLVLRDYKSKTTPLKNAPVLTSARLQVWLYAAALAADMDAFDGAVPGGVLLDRLYPDHRCTLNEYFVEGDEELKTLLPWRAEGAVTFEAARMLDAHLEPKAYSPVFVLRRKQGDGTVVEYDEGKSHVISPAEFEARLAQARETLLFAARGIVAGEISISPMLEERVRACHHCKFQSVCRFEPGEFRIRVAEDVLPEMSAGADSIHGGESCT